MHWASVFPVTGLNLMQYTSQILKSKRLIDLKNIYFTFTWKVQPRIQILMKKGNSKKNSKGNFVANFLFLLPIGESTFAAF